MPRPKETGPNPKPGENRDADWTPKEVLEHVELICHHPPLYGGLQRSNLLRYIVKQFLAGETPTEKNIATNAYGRGTNFKPEDSIVRGEIRKLRVQLAVFYEKQPEGKASSLRITIPKGGYKVHIERVEPTASSQQAPASGPVESASPFLIQPDQLVQESLERANVATVSNDYVEAVEWLRKAADAGSPTGIACLGMIYLHGRGGLPKDEVLAADCFRKAVEGGSAVGTAFLGVMYAEGLGGLPYDHIHAVTLFKRAAAMGCPHGMAAMAMMSEVRLDEGAVWLAEAIASGRTRATAGLEALFAKEPVGLAPDYARRLLTTIREATGLRDWEAAVLMKSISLFIAVGLPVSSVRRKRAQNLILARLRKDGFSEEFAQFLVLLI